MKRGNRVGVEGVRRRRSLRFEPLEDRRLLAITVNTLTDELDGSINDGDVSLRDALLAATPFETIMFDSALTSGGPATLALRLGELRVTKSVTIDGPGSGLLTISAATNDLTPLSDNGDGSRVFNVSDGSAFTNIDVRINALTLSGGDALADGGGVRNFENLTLGGVAVVDNHAQKAGGGIYSTQSLTLINSTVSGNSALLDGGGIGSTGAYLTVHGSYISNNQGRSGGGISSTNTAGYLTVTDSTITSNTASVRGGGVDESGSALHITGSTISWNSAQGGGGGGVFSSSTGAVLIANSVMNNSATGDGGGIFRNGATTTIASTEIRFNSAASGGGIRNEGGTLQFTGGTISNNGASGDGGGLWNNGSSVTLSLTTVADNSAAIGAGINNVSGALAINESTLSGNFASVDGGAVHTINALMTIASSTISGNSAVGNAGGLWVQGTPSQTVTISHSTITANNARANGFGSGGGGGLVTDLSVNVNLYHTILAGNFRAGSVKDDVFGKVAAVYSLIGVDSGALITDNGGNKIGTAAAPIDPLLAPLANNGGPTNTHVPLGGSPALDAGDPTLVAGGNAPLFDQRGDGHARILDADGGSGARIDIGAVEVAPGGIRGMKWEDIDADGVRDVGEPGLAGWTIYLDMNGNGEFDSIADGVEPDDSTAGTVLNNIKPGVTLSAVNSFSSNVTTGFASGSSASTGSLVFTNEGSIWGGSVGLRVDFAAPTDFVSIDAISDDSFDLGILTAYDSLNNIVDQFFSPVLGFNQVSTMSVTRAVSDIAYVIASGYNGEVLNLDNLHYGSSEPFRITDSTGSYEFDGLAPGQYRVGEVQQPGWKQTAPSAIADTLSSLNANNAAITALVPSRYNFSDGFTGTSISDGGNDMYDGGNVLSTDLVSSISYTNGVLQSSAAAFGPGSKYFTAKYNGLFTLAATQISINSFQISGNNGADGQGSVDGGSTTTIVDGKLYTIYYKRVYGSSDPSINHIMMVPGDGTGITHSFSSNTDSDLDSLTGLSSISEIYYALVARSSGQLLALSDIVSIANEYLSNLATTGIQEVLVASEQVANNIDFGNYALPGTLRGNLWNDANSDKVRQPAEGSLAGWTVYLDVNNNGTLDALASHVEPDDYAAGTVLNTVNPGVTLSTVGGSSTVLASTLFGSVASTGVLGFSDGGGQWGSNGLRADFATPTDFFSIDAIGDDSFDQGVLTAFDAAGNVLQEVISPGFGTNQVATLSITRPTADIAYVVVRGYNGEVINLDNLQFGASEPTAVTDASGDYVFSNLRHGDYIVRQVTQPNWEQTYPLASTNAVAVFDNGAVVDTSGTINAESDNIQATVASLGYTVSTFTGTNGADWTAAGSGRVLVIPEQENGALVNAIDAGAIAAIQSHVAQGGGLVIGGSHGNIGQTANALNTIFGFSLTEVVIELNLAKTAAATGTPFSDDVGLLPSNNGTTALMQVNLPVGAVTMYESSGAAAVAVLPYGLGEIVFIGWDWYDAAPAGTQDGGWVQVLGSALEMLSGTDAAGGHFVSLQPGEDAGGFNFGSHSQLATGDYNVNGSVDAADYVLWRKTLGTASIPAYTSADGNGDTTIAASDYDVWRANFGQSTPASAAATAATTSVAEEVAVAMSQEAELADVLVEVAPASSASSDLASSTAPTAEAVVTTSRVAQLPFSAVSSPMHEKATRASGTNAVAAVRDDALLACLNVRSIDHDDRQQIDDFHRVYDSDSSSESDEFDCVDAAVAELMGELI